VTADALPNASDFDLGDQPWDRRPNEPSKSYAAFRLYRDTTPFQRRIEDVANQVDRSSSQLRHLAQVWEWRERAAAWDEACHRVEDRERLDALRSMHSVHRRAGRAAVMRALQELTLIEQGTMPPSVIARLLELGAKLERSTLIVSVEELQGIAVEPDEDTEDPWERIARELDPATAVPDL
jgi:hypothetical protein